MAYKDLTAREKIVRAKIQLGYSKPFWSYLLMNAKIVEDNNMPMKTMGASNIGTIHYDKEFVNSLSEEELWGVLTHEVFHIAFRHLERLKQFKGQKENEKEAMAWNISSDIVTNYHLLKEGFEIVKGGIKPDIYDDKFEMLDKDGNLIFEVEEISKKSVERVYEDILSHFKNKNKDSKGRGYQKRISRGEKSDEHIFSGNSVKNAGGKKEKGNKRKDVGQYGGNNNQSNESNDKDWKRIISEAYTYAKQRGKSSVGIERMIGELLNPEINWKQRLYKYITKEIQCDFTYAKPSKRSMACGVYLPSPKRELLDVVVGVDVSGSISRDSYNKFISEMIGIARSFQSIRMRLISWEYQVKNTYEFKNGELDKIRNLKICGGGGTDINCLLSEMNEKYPSTRLLIVFTDGYFGNPKENINANIIWAITKGGTESYLDGVKGEIIKMDS